MSFDFSEEGYREPVEKQFMNTSGYITGVVTRCEYNSSYNSVGIDIESETESCRFLSLYMENKDGSKSPGYYHFMSLCKLLGVDKPVQDPVTDRFENIEGKPVTIGIKFVFTEGQQYPKKYIQSIHSSKTGCTYGEALEKKPAEIIKTAIKDQFKGFSTSNGDNNTGFGDTGPGEAPAGLERADDDQNNLPF